MHVLTAPLLANTAHDKISKGDFDSVLSVPDQLTLTDYCVCHLSDLQEGSAKINPVCPGQWNVQSPVKAPIGQKLGYIHNSSLT